MLGGDGLREDDEQQRRRLFVPAVSSREYTQEIGIWENNEMISVLNKIHFAKAEVDVDFAHGGPERRVLAKAVPTNKRLPAVRTMRRNTTGTAHNRFTRSFNNAFNFPTIMFPEPS
jgi:hypothetical protein